MSRKKDQSHGYGNHGRPITRRDMLAQGVMSYGAVAAMPSLLTMFSRTAQGAPICSVAGNGTRMVPFIIIDLAGGANIGGTNVIVGDRGGQTSYLPAGSYGTLGLAPEQEPRTVAPNTEMGLAFHPASKMLQGIKEVAAAATLANTDGAVFCTSSGDDTRSNPHNPLYWIARTGLKGELVSLVGTADGTSGGNAASPAASINPSLQPSRITRTTDALGLVDPGKLATLLGNTNDVNKVMKAIQGMSESRLRMFQEQDVPKQIQDLITCGYVNGAEYLSKFTPAQLDAAQDASITAAFPQIANNQQQQAAGSIAKLVLDGFAGAGVIQMGGYDYHGQGRATQDTRDLDAGRMIGRILQVAAAKSSPVMVYVYTDGGVSSGQNGAVNGIFPFSADSGERSAAFTLVYNPGDAGRTGIIRDAKRQIGAFKPGGSVDGAVNKISTSVENLSKAIVGNYLALHGMEDQLSTVLGSAPNPFSSTELEALVAFDQIVQKT
jgi:hypothetical protein